MSETHWIKIIVVLHPGVLWCTALCFGGGNRQCTLTTLLTTRWQQNNAFQLVCYFLNLIIFMPKLMNILTVSHKVILSMWVCKCRYLDCLTLTDRLLRIIFILCLHCVNTGKAKKKRCGWVISFCKKQSERNVVEQVQTLKIATVARKEKEDNEAECVVSCPHPSIMRHLKSSRKPMKLSCVSFVVL